MLVLPFLVHVTEGFGSPLTSHANIASSPTDKVVLIGSFLTTGLSERVKEYGFQFLFHNDICNTGIKTYTDQLESSLATEVTQPSFV